MRGCKVKHYSAKKSGSKDSDRSIAYLKVSILYQKSLRGEAMEYHCSGIEQLIT